MNDQCELSGFTLDDAAKSFYSLFFGGAFYHLHHRAPL